MQKSVASLILMVKRELAPARDSIGHAQFLYQLLVFDLPIIGIGFLLLLIAFAGLCLTGAVQDVEQRLTEFKTSPFSALFATASFQNNPNDVENSHNLNYWTGLRMNAIKFEQLSESHRDLPVFVSIKPFSEICLDIRAKNGELREFIPGMGLPTQGDQADTPLLNEVQQRLRQEYSSERAFQGIIVSTEYMRRLGWGEKNSYPRFLWIKLSKSNKSDKEIPFRLSVVDKLPYQYRYLLAIDELRKLNYGYYYDPINGFDLTFLTSNTITPQQLAAILPVGSKISTLLKGGREALRTVLPNALPRIEILERFVAAHFLDQNIAFALGTFDTMNYVEDYTGAIFRINFTLPNFIWSKDHIYQIKDFMSRKDIEIKGEVTELLGELLTEQENLIDLQTFFDKALWLIVVILLFFFAVVLHTRMHRIGTKRMLGCPDWMIAGAYSLVGLVLVIITFILAIVVMSYLYSPVTTQLSLKNQAVWTLLLKILLMTEVGLLAPVWYYLRTLQPAEMMSFRL